MKLKLIGYWKGGFDTANDIWPDPKDFVSEISFEEKQTLLSYLESAIRMPYAAAGVSECRFCGKAVGNGEYTDGKFLWPEGLAHYIQEHSVQLPEEFLAQALSGIKINPYLDLKSENIEIDTEWWKSKK